MTSLRCLSSSLFYRAICVGIAMFGFSVAAAGQVPSSTQVAEMGKLDFLIGEWKGQGWEFKLDGSRANSFSQKTNVQAREGDATLRIKDERAFKPLKGTMGRSKLDAIISYDETVKLYHWRGKNSKSILEAKLLSDRTFHYGMPFSITVEPRDGYRRTTIEVNENGEWHETLEVWVRGKWYKFEESILKKAK